MSNKIGGSKPRPITYEVNENGCHVCTSHAKDRCGYAQMSNDKRRIGVHRLVLERKLGRLLKDNYCACHTCDNPSCINPEHLFEGSVMDNARDRNTKGRNADLSKIRYINQNDFIAISPYGEKFTGDNQNKFARDFGLDRGHISKCLNGIQKRHKGWTFSYI